MNKLSTRFRIGEKIVLGFGAVGLLFLGIIWYYHTNVRDLTAAYQGLAAVSGARQIHAFAIESHLNAMRSGADRFLLTRDTDFAEQTLVAAAALRAEAEAFGRIDAASARTAAEIDASVEAFADHFEAIVAGWRARGLDEDSGLQGAFRDAVHELQDRAAHYNVDRLYLLLLQVRRSEKDLGLRREDQYRVRVNALLDEMQATTAASRLQEDTRQALQDEIVAYRQRFGAYAERVLAGEPIEGGKGLFRDRAHRIEDLLQAHYVPGLETAILQMRRREKDYLLRGDAQYIDMVDDIAGGIAERIAGSAVAADQQQLLSSLLERYRQDFLALVDQNTQIARSTDAMYQAAAQITPLVERNLAQATATMAEQSEEIAAASAERARWSLVVAAVVPVLGFLLALLITSRIVRPVQRMVGLLDQLTREAPRDRLEVDPAGRDEINAMAIALNTLADHRARFSEWWRSSMQGEIACRDLQEAGGDEARAEAAVELRNAVGAKLSQLDAEGERMLDGAERLDAMAADQSANARGRVNANALREIAGNLRALARMVAAH